MTLGLAWCLAANQPYEKAAGRPAAFRIDSDPDQKVRDVGPDLVRSLELALPLRGTADVTGMVGELGDHRDLRGVGSVVARRDRRETKLGAGFRTPAASND